MTSRLNPYLNFKDTARAAMEFYRDVFGGELSVSTFGDMAEGPDETDKIMHAMLVTPSGFTLMGSDTPDRMEFTPGNTMTVSLSGDDEADLQGYWDKLSEGATIRMPLAKAPWGDSFGMLVDQFGTPWMVNITGSR